MGDYKAKRREVKKMIRKKKEDDRERTLRFIEENGGTQCKRFWSDLKSRGKKRTGCLMEVWSGAGEVLTEAEDVNP